MESGSGNTVVDMPLMSMPVEFPDPVIPGRGLFVASKRTPVTETRLALTKGWISHPILKET